MKKSLKLIAAALTAITAMSCASVTASADRLETYGGVTYRYSDTGRYLGRFTGWSKSRGKMYYYLDGVKVTKNMVINGRRFRFDKNGVYLGKYTGWTTAEDKNKHYWKDGEMLKNTWVKMKNGKYRYVDGAGNMRIGWAMVTRGGNGKYSYFDRNGYWDGKTYYTGYRVNTLADVFKDIDFFSGDRYYYAIDTHQNKYMKSFNDSDLLYQIISKDLKTPLLWDDLVTDDEYGIAGGISRAGTRIVLRSSVDKNLDLELTQVGGRETYLYNTYYGFGLKLTDGYAFSKIARAIGLTDWSYTEPDDEGEDYNCEYEDPEPLDEEQEQEIISDFLKYKAGTRFWKTVKSSDLRIYGYYGTYKNGEVVIVYGDELEVLDDINEIEIEGYTIELGSSSYEMLLHCGGTFYEIDEAYEMDLLSLEDIAAISYYSTH